tara:strand:- start:49 stop:666 length:618 start_codon:yes stop_codon:yes gene_type:complete
MGAGSAGSNDKGSNPNLNKGTVQFKTNKKKTNKSLSDFESRNLSIYKSKKDITPLLRGTRKLLEPGYKKDLNFFTNKVLSSSKAKKNIGYTKEEFASLSAVKQDEVAKNFRTRRNAGLTDAYGNVKIGNGGGGDKQPVIVQKNVGGKTIQTTEAKVEEDKKDSPYDPRKTKKKGMTKNILTSKQGITKTSSDYTLGKVSLLGKVV